MHHGRTPVAVASRIKQTEKETDMENFSLWGAIVNTLTVILGSAIGLTVKQLVGKNSKSGLTANLSDAILKGLALCVLGIGITGTIKAAVNGQIVNVLGQSGAVNEETLVSLTAAFPTEESLVIVLSVAIGATVGTLINLDKWINRLGEKVESLTRARFGNVAQGFVSASLLFCVGSMTIVGALNSGLLGDHSMLYTKSLLDFVSSILLSVSMGIGVLFSAVFVLLFEGSITLLAQWIAPFLTANVITCMSGVGSILIIGLALNVLGVTKLKIMNYMPAVFLPVVLIPLAEWIGNFI